MQKVATGLIWGTWLFNSFLLMLILLNFLIAILCSSFDEVQNKADQFKYISRCSMNCDTMLILKVINQLNPFEAIILTCNVTQERSEDPIDKAVVEINENMM